MARAAFEAGRAAFDTGHYEEALERFEESYALSHEADLLYNIGHTAERLRRDQQALAAFEAYLTARPNVENREAIEARMVMLRASVEGSDVGPGNRSIPDVEEESSTAGQWTLVIGGAATAVVGGVLLAVAAGQANEVTEAGQGSSWSEVSGAYGSAGTYTLVGALLLGAGSAAATVGIVWLLAGDDDNEPVEVLVSLNGLSIQGSF